jgi:drug/metabolite transporter (DMT)-like permease
MALSRTQCGIAAGFAAIYVIWGSTYLALALALQSLPPYLLMAARCLIGGAILYGCSAVTGPVKPSWRTCVLAAVCGVLFFVGCHGVLADAQQRVPSGLAAILLATIPLWITLLQALVPGAERPTSRTIAWLFPGVAGVALIARREATSGASAVGAADVLLLLGASFSWAAGTFISERHSHAFPPMPLSGLELLAGGLVLLAISAARGELSALHLSAVSAVSMIGWIYLTLIGTVVAFAAFNWLLKHVSPTRVATYTFVNPVIAVLLGWAFLGETPTLWMLMGAILIIASVAGLLLARGQSSRTEKKSRSTQTSVRPAPAAGRG